MISGIIRENLKGNSSIISSCDCTLNLWISSFPIFWNSWFWDKLLTCDSHIHGVWRRSEPSSGREESVCLSCSVDLICFWSVDQRTNLWWPTKYLPIKFHCRNELPLQARAVALHKLSAAREMWYKMQGRVILLTYSRSASTIKQPGHPELCISWAEEVSFASAPCIHWTPKNLVLFLVFSVFLVYSVRFCAAEEPFRSL